MTGRNQMALCFALAAGLAAVPGLAQQTPSPEFHPPDGASVPVSVVISCVSPEAQVYYTTDGTQATSNSIHYNLPLLLTNTTTLRARAYLTGFSSSEEQTATYYEHYALVTVQKLVANNGTPKASVSVNVTPAASVRSYAIEETIPAPLEPSNIMDGGTWDEDNRTIRWGPFEDSQTRSLTYQVSCWQDGVWEIIGCVSLNGFSTQSDDSTTKATVTIQHTYAQVANPVFSPPSGAMVPITVALSCATTNASIFFTTNGTVPDTNSMLYVASLLLTNTTFLRARAFAEGMEPSDVTGSSYWESDAPAVPIRSITNISGNVANVRLCMPIGGVQCDALIESLPNGLEPSQISSNGVWDVDTGTIMWGPFRGILPTNLTYQVTGPDGTYTLDGMGSFDGRSVAVTGDTQIVIARLLQQVATPQFAPPGGAALPTSVTITCTTLSAVVYYTTNGAIPTTSDLLYTDPLPVAADTILRARAFKDGWLPSEPASASYLAAPQTPALTRTVSNNVSALPDVYLAFMPVSGTKSYAAEETVPQALTPSGISNDGSWDETAGTIRWGPFEDDTPRTLTYSLQGPDGAYALDGQGSFDGRSFSITGAAQVVVVNGPEQQVATPILSPATSTTMPVTVTISCGTGGAEIRYTTNGIVPGTNATLYTAPLELTVATALRVRAFKAGMNASDTVSGNYLQGELSLGNIVRTVANNVSSTPTCNLAVTPSSAVKSYAVEERLPTLLLPSSISNGGSWDEATSTLRWGPFCDNASRLLSYTVSAPDGDYALDGSGSFDGWSAQTTGDQSVSIVGHLEQVAMPEFSPPSGGQVPVTVTISCVTPGAVVYYTTSGLVPTTNDTPYTVPVSLTGETTLRARAFKTILLPSDTASATYPAALNVGTIVRAIRGSPSTVQDVSLMVTPAAFARVYSVEEYVPLSLEPSAVNGDGKWSAEDRLIRWGPFLDHQARTFSYSVSGPDGNYYFDGAASFDGINRSAMGDTTAVIRFPAPTSLTAVAGNGAVYLRWARSPGAVGYNVYFWTAGNANSPQVLNAGNPSIDYFPVNGLTNNTEYYFSVTACDSAGHKSGHSENIKAVPSASGGALGVVWFDRTAYRPTDWAVLSVMDADLNTDTGTAQSVTVKITSDSDAWGFTMTLVEAGVNTSLFTSEAAGTNLDFTFGASDPTNKLIQITEGARITVVYNDVQPAIGLTNTAVVESSPPATLIVLPVTTTSYGTLLVGDTKDRTFVVSNVGTFNIAGIARVGEPFNVVSGGSYTLVPGQFTNTTVRYAPVAAGNNVATVTFTGGSGASLKLSGSAFNDPTPTRGMIAGQVTRSDTHAALNGIRIIAVGPNGSHDTVSQSGRYSIGNLDPNAHYQVRATPEGQPFNMTNLYDVAVVAGQTTTTNITMTPANQPPVSTPTNTPVVLVRGIGPDVDWDADGGSNYWVFVRNALRAKGFTNVWDCNEPDADSDHNPSFPVNGGHGHVINGQLGIETNACALKYYINQKAQQFNRDNKCYPPTINIVAHSMGGLIARCAMDADGKLGAIQVGKVIMLATPNAGTKLADYALLDNAALYTAGLIVPFNSPDVPLFWPGSCWPATTNLTTDWVQNHFNRGHKWPTKVKLFLLGGGGGWGSSNSQLRWGAFILHYRNALHSLEQVNDGAVTWPSVQGMYYKLSLPWMDQLPVKSVDFTPTSSPELFNYYDHNLLLNESDVKDWIVAALSNTENGVVQGAESNSMQSHGVGIVSQITTQSTDVTNALPLHQVDQLSCVLTSGAVNKVSEICDAVTIMAFQLYASATDVVFRVRDPSGMMIDSMTMASNCNAQYSVMICGSNSVMIACTISNPATGIWQAILDGSSMTATQANCTLMVFGDSSVALLPQTGPLFNQGQDVVLSCALADLSANPAMPVGNASIMAKVQLPDGTTNSLMLVDDGWHNDGSPNDGVYAAVLTNAQQAGRYMIAYRATGTNGQGQALQRVATGAFSTSSGHGSLWGDPVYENLDTDGDGIADFLKVKVWVNPTAAGNYILACDLVDASGTHRFSQSTAFAADGSGPTMATLIFDLAEIRTVGGPGIYHIENLQLFEVTSAGTAWLDTYQDSSIVNIQAIPPVITVSPQSLTNNTGSLAIFSVTATGTLPLYYQWQINETNIVSANLTNYTIISVTKTNEGGYHCIVSNVAGCVTSSVATLTVLKLNQTIIALSDPGDQLTTNTVSLSATASSGLPVTFAVGSGPAQISDDTNLSFTGAGVVSIIASQTGDATWNPAPNVTNTINVTKASQAALVFNPTSPQTYNTTNALSTSGGSGSGAVGYAVQSGPGQIVGASNLWATAGTGTVMVVATKSADTMYDVRSVTSQVVAAKATQAITFPAIPAQIVTNTVGLRATAYSGLLVVFSVWSGSAQISGGTNLTFMGAGSVSIVASQAGDTNWNPAPNMTNTFNVVKASQAALVFTPSSPQVYLTTNALSVSGGSGTGALSYAVASGPGEIMSSTLLAMRSGTGIVMVTATKAADVLYIAQMVTAQVAAVQASQTITNFTPTNGSVFVTTNTVGLAAQANSGLAVTNFMVISGPGVIFGLTNLTFTNSGTVNATAHQDGSTNWNPAPTVTNTYTVVKAMASVILTNLTQTYDGKAKTVAATTIPSGLMVAVTYNGNTWAPTNVGDYAVTGMVNDVLYQGSTNGMLAISALPSPTALPATSITPSNFVANWTAVTTATNYLVDVSTTNDFSIYLGGFGNFAAGNTISCTVTGVNLGLTYYYRLRAQNTGMTSTNSGTISVLINSVPSLGTTTVSNIMANTANLGGSVTTTNGFPVLERGIYWDTNAGAVLVAGIKYSESGVFAMGAFSFQVTNLPAGRTNYFLAYAANAQGTNVTSEHSFLTRPEAPTTLAANNGTVSAFWANWQTTESATNYWLDVAPTNDFAKYLAGYSNRAAGLALTCSVTGLQTRVVYYYRVRSENATGASTNSAVMTVSAGAIGLLPTSLNFVGVYGGTKPAAQSFIITNSGYRGFYFTNSAEYSANASGWWRTTPVTGALAGTAYQAITGNVDITGLNVGTYYVTNAVMSSEVTNSPKYLVATLTVSKGNQTITNFTPMGGSSFATTSAVQLFAQASSELAVTNFAVISGPGVISGLTNLTFTNSGSVSVTANQAGDTNWYPVPTVTNTFNVTKVTASVTLTNLNQPYDGTPRMVGVTTVPSGLPVTITYNGSATAPIAVGNYAVTGVVNSALYQGSASGTLTVSKATATVTLNNLSQTYDGTPRVVTASSVPSLPLILLTYNGDATAPVNVGTYIVIGTVNNAFYAGAATGTLIVAKANQAITFPTIPNQFVTSHVNLLASANSSLPVTFMIQSGPAIITSGTASFTGTGQVAIAATQAGNANWNAAASVINTFNVMGISIQGIINADFDGDRKADPSVYDQNTGTWLIRMSGSGYATMILSGLLGGPGYVAAVADYDGDGLSDPAVYQEATGKWIILQSGSRYARLENHMGGLGWAPASADYDGDNQVNYAVYQEVTGDWNVNMSSGSFHYNIMLYNFLGGPGFSIASADYDGDGLADPAVYNRTDGTWKILLSRSGYFPLTLRHFLGGTDWNAVPGDYDGDGLADPAVRKSDGSEWRIMLSGSGYALITVPLGL